VLLRGDQPRTFTFDGVLGDGSSQDEVFDAIGRRIGSGCFSGYNGSVYVYGQTGAGKTYTLFVLSHRCSPCTSMNAVAFSAAS
jgi:Cdc6-like AAA superfamily ATPase